MVQVNAKLDTTSLADVLQHTQDAPGVSVLSLCRSGLTPSLAVQLADFLEANASLTHVDLSGNRLGEHGAGCLATSLIKNSAVQSLVLDDCGLTSAALKEWVGFFRSGTNTTLRHLSLAHNQIDDDGAEALGAMLRAVKTRDMRFDLRSNELSTRGLHILADALKDACPTAVTALQVAHNQDDDDPEAVAYQTRLEFYLRRNKAAIERAILIETIKNVELSSLELVVCTFTHIVLTIAETRLLGAALQKTHSVTELRLQDNALPEEGIRCILRALRSNCSVRHLSLVDNNIGDGGFRALNELLRVSTTALRVVTVANPTQLAPENGLEVMTLRTVSALHYTLANYALLTSLSLANCGLDDVMVGVLVSGVAWSGRMEALDLQRNSFGDRSVYVLARMMQRCLRLYRLDLSGNKFTLAGLLSLLPVVSCHPQLRVLLLGRFPSCEMPIMNQIINAAERSPTLVQLELITRHRRTRTSECVAMLNAHLRAAHGTDLEQERQERTKQINIHEKECCRRALVHHEARAFVNQLASHD